MRSAAATTSSPDGGDADLTIDPDRIDPDRIDPDRIDRDRIDADHVDDDRIDDELIAALRIGVLRLSRRLRLEHGGDLTLTQLSVLAAVARHHACTIGELAQFERVKPPAMTRTVTHLEEIGLVTRCAHDSDGRQVIVKLTDAGHAVLAENRRRRDAWLREHLRDLSPADRRALEAAAPLLERLAQS